MAFSDRTNQINPLVCQKFDFRMHPGVIEVSEELRLMLKISRHFIQTSVDQHHITIDLPPHSAALYYHGRLSRNYCSIMYWLYRISSEYSMYCRQLTILSFLKSNAAT